MTPPKETTQPAPVEQDVEKVDALAKALCLLDTFAGEGLGHTYGNGQTLDADDVCAELAAAFGIECEPGWYRTVAAIAAISTLTPARAEGFKAGVEACKDKLKAIGFNNVDEFFSVLLESDHG